MGFYIFSMRFSLHCQVFFLLLTEPSPTRVLSKGHPKIEVRTYSEL